jgi:hypothetical protein
VAVHDVRHRRAQAKHRRDTQPQLQQLAPPIRWATAVVLESQKNDVRCNYHAGRYNDYYLAHEQYSPNFHALMESGLSDCYSIDAKFPIYRIQRAALLRSGRSRPFWVGIHVNRRKRAVSEAMGWRAFRIIADSFFQSVLRFTPPLAETVFPVI